MSFIKKLLGRDAPSEQPAAPKEPVQTVQGLIPGEKEPVDAAMDSGASGPGVLRSQDGGKDWAEPTPGGAANVMSDYGYGDTMTHEGQGGHAPEAALGTDVVAAASGAPAADIGMNEKWMRGDSGSWNADAGPGGGIGEGAGTNNANVGTPVDVFGQVVLGPQGSPAPAQSDALYVDETGVIEATVTPPAQQATPTADADDALADREPPPEAQSGWYATEPSITLGSTDPPADSAGASIPPEFKAVVGGLDDERQATTAVPADAGGDANDMPAPPDAPSDQGDPSVVGETPAAEVYDSPADLNNLHFSSVKPSSRGSDAPADGQADVVVATSASEQASPEGSDQLASEDLEDEGSPLLVSLEEGTQPLSVMPAGAVEVDASEAAEGLVDADEPDL